MLRLLLFLFAVQILGIQNASSQTAYLYAEVDPEWKVNSIDFWDHTIGKRISEGNIKRINELYESLNNTLSLESYKIVRESPLFKNTERVDNPTALRPGPGSFYIDVRSNAQAVIDRFPYYKKQIGTENATVIYSFIVFNGNGKKLAREEISQEVNIKEVTRGKLRGMKYYEQDIEGYGEINKASMAAAITTFMNKLASNTDLRAELEKKDQNPEANGDFNEEMKILFESRKNKYPDHYKDFNISRPAALDLAARDVKVTTMTDAVPALNDHGIAQDLGDELRRVNNYALVIGVNEYIDPTVNDLDHPIDDAQQVADVLTTNYTFDKDNLVFLKNPKREDIIKTFDYLAAKLTSSDNLLIFYAGHGIWDENLKKGYWLPSDAQEGNRSKWFSNSDLRDYVGGIKAKHTLLIADACFSGGIFKTREAFTGVSKAVLEIYNLPSRKAMTSGAMKTVPDKSVFLGYLLKRLQENTEAFLPSETLFASFKQAVINNSPNGQVPQFGEIRETGDEGGDFIFIRRN